MATGSTLGPPLPQQRATTQEKGKGKAIEQSPQEIATAAAADSLPWVEKYRPNTLDDLISHKDIISTITRFIDENKLPHMLFYGPPGTGKTSTILACARRLYGEKYRSMILELNASDDRGIDVVREQIKNFASTRKLFSTGFKIIILDEADAMTQTAQNALRRVIEQYTRNVRFCLICNYVGKIIPALQSRCTRFRFAPLQQPQIKDRIEFIIGAEGIKITDDGRQAVLRLAQGDMRRALNILQAVHTGYPIANEDTIYECTGSPLPSDIEQITNWLFSMDFATCYQSIRALKREKGLALADLLFELTLVIADMEMPVHARVYLLEKMADIEYNVCAGGTEDIQLAALVGTFRLSVDLAAKTDKDATK